MEISGLLLTFVGCAHIIKATTFREIQKSLIQMKIDFSATKEQGTEDKMKVVFT